MKQDVEGLIVSWGNEQDDLPEFFSEVPPSRPDRFVTVERTGGASERFRDTPTVALQAWASNRAAASALMLQVENAVNRDLRYHDHVARIQINTVTNFPGPEGEPRYQALLLMVTD